MRPSPVLPHDVSPVQRPTLRVVPEPVAPPEGRGRSIAIIGFIVLVVLAGMGGVYVSQHDLVTQRDATIATLQSDVAGLQAQVTDQQGSAAVAQQTVLNQQQVIAGLRTQNATLQMEYQIAVGNERTTQQALAQSQAQLQAANQTVQTLVGAPLADGTYVGYLMAVGAQQSPPRLVIDRAKMTPDQGLVDASPAWRTVPITPTASVVVLSLQPYHPQAISLERFAHLFVNPAPWADRVTLAPFNITVSGGVVTAIREFRPPA